MFLCAFSITGFAADKIKPTNTIDTGTDGDIRVYIVYCSDGKRNSVEKRIESGDVCTHPASSDKNICKNWTVDEAAIASCN